MAHDDRDRAREHANRAARQARHAAKNVGNAAEAEKEHIADNIREAVRPINPGGFFTVMSDVGSGVFATMVAITAAAIATHKFRSAYVTRGRMVSK